MSSKKFYISDSDTKKADIKNVCFYTNLKRDFNICNARAYMDHPE